MALRGRSMQPAAVAKGGKQFLVVQCGAMPVAITSDIVRGIHEPSGEGSRDASESIVTLGVAYSVASLPQLSAPSAASVTADRRVILISGEGRRRALWVDRVHGLIDVEEARLRPLPVHFSGPERGWITGFFLFEDGLALVADTGWLLGRESNPYAVQPTFERPARGVGQGPDTIVSPGHQAAAPAHADLPQAAGGFEEATDAEDTPWAQL